MHITLLVLAAMAAAPAVAGVRHDAPKIFNTRHVKRQFSNHTTPSITRTTQQSQLTSTSVATFTASVEPTSPGGQTTLTDSRPVLPTTPPSYEADVTYAPGSTVVPSSSAARPITPTTSPTGYIFEPILPTVSTPVSSGPSSPLSSSPVGTTNSGTGSLPLPTSTAPVTPSNPRSELLPASQTANSSRPPLPTMTPTDSASAIPTTIRSSGILLGPTGIVPASSSNPLSSSRPSQTTPGFSASGSGIASGTFTGTGPVTPSIPSSSAMPTSSGASTDLVPGTRSGAPLPSTGVRTTLSSVLPTATPSGSAPPGITGGFNGPGTGTVTTLSPTGTTLPNVHSGFTVSGTGATTNPRPTDSLLPTGTPSGTPGTRLPAGISAGFTGPGTGINTIPHATTAALPTGTGVMPRPTGTSLPTGMSSGFIGPGTGVHDLPRPTNSALSTHITNGFTGPATGVGTASRPTMTASGTGTDSTSRPTTPPILPGSRNTTSTALNRPSSSPTLSPPPPTTTTTPTTPAPVPTTPPEAVTSQSATATFTVSAPWLPSTIVVAPTRAPSSPESHESTETGLPTNLPKALTPDTPVEPPLGTTRVQIGFKYSLNYPFIVSNQKAAAQVFQLLPIALAGASQISEDRFAMQKLMPLDTRDTKDVVTGQCYGYITTLAIVFVPTAWVGELQRQIWSPNSALYHGSNMLVNNLTAQINVAIPIAYGSLPDGHEANSGGSSGGGIVAGGKTKVGASDPFSGGAETQSQNYQGGTVAGIAIGSAAVAAAYGAAMFIIARRYKRKKQAHRRSSSITNPSDMRVTTWSSPAMGDALSRDFSDPNRGGPMDGSYGRLIERERDSHASGPGFGSAGSGMGQSQRTPFISAPMAAENSLGWH